MSDPWDDYDMMIGYRWNTAKDRRMQRTEEETAALHQRLARQRIRAILNRMVRR